MSDTAFGVPCQSCKATGIQARNERYPHRGSFCPDCDGVGYTGIDPLEPSANVAGSDERIARYATRYREGYPLWNPSDYRPPEDAPTETPEPLGATPDEDAAEYAEMLWDDAS